MSRWGIRVVFANGDVGFLRHGPASGHGPIVRFPNKKTAEVNLDFIRQGLEQGTTANLFKILDRPKRQRTKSMTTMLRPELEPLPTRMLALPVDARGYVVPWFVQWVRIGSDPLEPMAPGPGAYPEFRAMDHDKLVGAIRDRRCWVCGGPMGIYQTFVIGPMGAITRTASEPPSHTECAEWSARNCPFLSRPHMVRREDERTSPLRANVAGMMIDRNPGVALLWTTKRYVPYDDGRGRLLLEIGEPTSVQWFAEKRPATRAEVLASIDSGLPFLRQACDQEATPDERAAAHEELTRKRAALEPLLPS